MEHTLPFILEKPKIDPNRIPGRKDLVEFFDRQGLNRYLNRFPETVNFGYFKTMSDDDFMEYGITEDEDIQILLEAVNKACKEEEESEAYENEVKPGCTIFLFW